MTWISTFSSPNSSDLICSHFCHSELSQFDYFHLQGCQRWKISLCKFFEEEKSGKSGDLHLTGNMAQSGTKNREWRLHLIYVTANQKIRRCAKFRFLTDQDSFMAPATTINRTWHRKKTGSLCLLLSFLVETQDIADQKRWINCQSW